MACEDRLWDEMIKQVCWHTMQHWPAVIRSPAADHWAPCWAITCFLSRSHMQLFLACKICKYRVYFCCLEWPLWWLWPMHRMGGGGVHTKYFWVTQYWLLLVTLVQLSQLFSIFTTSPTSPNHSQSRVCKYLTLIEHSILVTRSHLWGACSLSSGVWTQTINDSFLQRLFCPFYPLVSDLSKYLLSVSAVLTLQRPGRTQSWPLPGPGCDCLLW